jgi:hypothetical protein
MNQAEFFIQAPSTGTVHLRRAVLIYDGQQGSALATVHDIEEFDGEAVIGAGQAMTPRAAMDLAKALLKRAAHGGFLPETVLYMDGDLIVWWVPRPAATSPFVSIWNRPRPSAGGAWERAPSGTGLCASSRVWRWAAKGAGRPTPATPCSRCLTSTSMCGATFARATHPFPRVRRSRRSPRGTMPFCAAISPTRTAPAAVRYRGGAYAFWREMLDGRFQRFPERVLVDAKMTLGGLLGLKEGA